MTSGWYLTNDKAVIMIAHRLKTVQKAERIFALEDGNEYQPDAFVGCAKRFEYANGVYSVEHDDNQACDDWKARNKSHQSKHYGYVGVQQVEPCEMGGIAFAYGW